MPLEPSTSVAQTFAGDDKGASCRHLLAIAARVEPQGCVRCRQFDDIIFAAQLRDEIETASSLATLEDKLSRAAARLTFSLYDFRILTKFPGISSPIREKAILSTFPATWRLQSTDAISGSALPRISVTRLWHAPGRCERSTALLSGISVFLPLSRFQASVLTLASNVCGHNADIAKTRLAAIQLLGLQISNAVAALVPDIVATKCFHVTRHERRCLYWCAQGKTSWEISKIIGRSVPTVNFHINNAVRKLDATNRTEAVVRAFGLGMLGPDDTAGSTS